jgi:hypothetical protein
LEARDYRREAMLKEMDVVDVADMMRRIHKEERWFYVESEMAREARRVAHDPEGQNNALSVRSWTEGDLHG